MLTIINNPGMFDKTLEANGPSYLNGKLKLPWIPVFISRKLRRVKGTDPISFDPKTGKRAPYRTTYYYWNGYWDCKQILTCEYTSVELIS